MKGFTMNRFLSFVLFSVALHLAVGAALFSGTEMLGNKKAASHPNQTNEGETIDITPVESQQTPTPTSIKSTPPKKPTPPPVTKKKPKKSPIINTLKKDRKKPTKKKVKSLPKITKNNASKENKNTNTNNKTKNNQLNTKGTLPTPQATLPAPHQAIEKIKEQEEEEQMENDTENNIKDETENANVEKQEIDELIDEEDEIIEESPKDEKNAPPLSNQENKNLPTTNKPSAQKPSDMESKNNPQTAPVKKNDSSNIAAVSSNNSLPKVPAALPARTYTQLKQKEGNPIPKYPKKARIKKLEGDVELVYYVNPVGFVENIHVNRSSGHNILDNEAIRTLSRYHYYPGQEGWVKHLVKFSLDKESEIKETISLRTLEQNN